MAQITLEMRRKIQVPEKLRLTNEHLTYGNLIVLETPKHTTNYLARLDYDKENDKYIPFVFKKTASRHPICFDDNIIKVRGDILAIHKTNDNNETYISSIILKETKKYSYYNGDLLKIQDLSLYKFISKQYEKGMPKDILEKTVPLNPVHLRKIREELIESFCTTAEQPIIQVPYQEEDVEDTPNQAFRNDSAKIVEFYKNKSISNTQIRNN